MCHEKRATEGKKNYSKTLYYQLNNSEQGKSMTEEAPGQRLGNENQSWSEGEMKCRKRRRQEEKPSRTEDFSRVKSKYPNSEKHKNQTEGTNHTEVIFITEHKPENTLTST